MQVLENLRYIQHAPSVQMQEVSAFVISCVLAFSISTLNVPGSPLSTMGKVFKISTPC